MSWISVENQVPERGDVIDIWVKCPSSGGDRVTDVTYLGTGYQDYEGSFYSKGEVTHWRYPPAPPPRN